MAPAAINTNVEGLSVPEDNSKRDTKTSPVPDSFGDAGLNLSDATMTKVEVEDVYKIPKILYTGAGNCVTSDILDYLARPFIAETGTLASTDSRTTFSWVSPFKNKMVSTNTTYYYRKLAGYHMIRCTLNLRLQVNANKFQSGRYILAWLPTGGGSSQNQMMGEYQQMHAYSLYQITQLPHCEIDINRETSTEISIPFMNCFQGYPLMNLLSNKTWNDVGYYRLIPYVPLGSASGSTTAGYVIWMWLTDVELSGVAFPESGWRFESGSLSETNKGEQGPVESTLKKVSKSANIVSRIPLLSSFTKPLSWVTNILGDAAHVWGWSSPVTQKAVERVVSMPMGYMACSNVNRASYPLSLSVDNELSTAPGFAGKDVDELSISYFVSIPTFIYDASFTTSNVKDDVLFSAILSLPAFKTTFTDGSITTTCFSTVTFAAAHFDYWRGSLKFKFKIVKTEFHTGRLMLIVAYDHSRLGLTPTATVGTSQYGLRTIIDIREQTEFCCTVPFMALSNWARYVDKIGDIKLVVLDPLVAPATVTSSIDILVEIAGGDDFEVAYPTIATGYPITPVCGYQYQSGDLNGNEDLLSDDYLGGVKPVSHPTIDAEYCMGEKILSLRSLFKRFCYWCTSGTTSCDTHTLRPYEFDMAYNADGSHYYTFSHPADILTRFASCYAMVRGGIRIRAVMQTPTMLNWMAYLGSGYPGSAVGPIALSSGISFTSACINSQVRGVSLVRSDLSGLDVQIPYYYEAHSMPVVTNLAASTGNLYDATTQQNELNLVVNFPSATTTPVYYFRSAADDFNLGCFVSIPPMIVGTT